MFLKKLPYMQEYDPVARYYGFKRGEVVKIFRTDDSDEEKIFYRLVVRSKSEG
jgi:DNA-directed RNA polymerase I, II, and III subunit RPABC1